MSFDRRLKFLERLVGMDDEDLADLSDAVDYEWQCVLVMGDGDGVEVLRDDILTRSRMIATERVKRRDGTRQAERDLAETQRWRYEG